LMGVASRRVILLSCKQLRPIGAVQLEFWTPPGNRLANVSYKKKHFALSDMKEANVFARTSQAEPHHVFRHGIRTPYSG